MARRRSAAALLALGSLAACAAPDAVAPSVSAGPSLSRADAGTTGLPVLASARSNKTEPAHLDRGRFNITLKYVVPVTPAQQAVFEEAAARWEKIIVADVPSVSGVIPSAFPNTEPASIDVVDDIVIEVNLTYIDGPGVNGRNVLGSAGPRYLRTADRLPVSGLMRFDTYDLGLMEQRGIFDEVIVHEMGHVLGIGTLWTYFRALRQGPVIDYAYVGKYGNIHWNAEGGEGLLPIANVGAAGSIGGHWREAVMKNELMTPSINLGENPLSRISAAAMRDLGYGTGVVGERYELERGALGATDPNAEAAAVAAAVSAGGLDIAESEELLLPVGEVVPAP
jgi:hypothetical protein